MKLPAHLYLDKLGIDYTTQSFSLDSEKGAISVANKIGFPKWQTLKTLIFEAGNGECVMVLLGGDQSAISGNLKKAIGSRDIRMAASEVVKETTGYVVGSIPPFNWQPEGFRSYLEASLLNEPLLAVGAGQWGQEIFITPQNLIKATKTIIVNLMDKDQPVYQE